LNHYASILKDNLPRLLSQFDLDAESETFGFGDRTYWGWKVSDFANATPQAGVHSLAAAISLNLCEEKLGLFVIDAAINALPKISSKKGSLQEAYPNEHSFCVTALVAFDVLIAIHRLDSRLSQEKKKQYLKIVEPFVRFICENGEEHAIISNHLATGVAAIVYWNHFTGENLDRHETLLEIIYRHQSSEGWHREYEGADPGYETLCLYYLSAAHEIWPNADLFESIKRATSFLEYFVHPDHTIGGLYGSRNTEVYYPGGMVYVGNLESDFQNTCTALSTGAHVLPSQIDMGNFVPLLNAYSFAAFHIKESSDSRLENQQLIYQKEFEKSFDESGIFIKSTSSYYAIVNFKKGGTIKVFDKKNSALDLEDGGLVGSLNSGLKFSTQVFQSDLNFQNHSLNSGFFQINKQSPTPFTTLIIRVLSLTFFGSVFFGNLFKKAVVRLLMTGKSRLDGLVERSFRFSEDSIEVFEKVKNPKQCSEIHRGGKFTSIHMASSGYFMENRIFSAAQNSKLVSFK
jgi:hypothetical protein